MDNRIGLSSWKKEGERRREVGREEEERVSGGEPGGGGITSTGKWRTGRT